MSDAIVIALHRAHGVDLLLEQRVAAVHGARVCPAVAIRIAEKDSGEQVFP